MYEKYTYTNSADVEIWKTDTPLKLCINFMWWKLFGKRNIQLMMIQIRRRQIGIAWTVTGVWLIGTLQRIEVVFWKLLQFKSGNLKMKETSAWWVPWIIKKKKKKKIERQIQIGLYVIFHDTCIVWRYRLGIAQQIPRTHGHIYSRE